MRQRRRRSWTSQGVSELLVSQQNIVAHVKVPVGEGGSLDLETPCFFSGKIVITGAKCMSDVHDSWKHFHRLLQTYKTSSSS